MTDDSAQTLLCEALLKEQKTEDDAMFIFEKIRSLQFFNTFFAQNLRTIDSAHILKLCKGFTYERVPMGEFVFRKGDVSNNKFYVILSGQVGIVKTYGPDEPSNDFESDDTSALKGRHSAKASTTLLNEPFSLKSAGSSMFSKERSTITSGQSLSPIAKIKTSINELWTANSESPERSPDQLDRPRAKTIIVPSKPERGISISLRSKIKALIALSNPEYDGKDFEGYAERFGKLFRCLGEGESFGELALKNDAPRSASILCKTNCEFLIITKQQFDLIFLKEERDKEDFLKEVFPFVSTLIASSVTFNDFFYSFQTECYTKGTYLVTEGKLINKEPNLFLIYQGECLVEKTITIEAESPNDKSKSSTNSQTIRIAIIGKGTIIGEEVLISKEGYNYSVKALSENVIVHSISKKYFDALYFKEFHNYVVGIYTKKKNQRDLIVESSKKELEAIPRKSKVESPLLSKAVRRKRNASFTIQEMNRNFPADTLSPPANDARKLSTLFSSPRLPPKSPAELSPALSLIKSPSKDRTMTESELPPMELLQATRDARGMLKAVDLYDPKKKKIASKLEYISRVHGSQKHAIKSPERDDFDTVRLFDKNSSKIDKALKITKRVSQDRTSVQTNSTNLLSMEKRDGMTTVGLILKDVARSTRDFKLLSTRFDNTKDEYKSKERDSVEIHNVHLKPLLQESPNLSPSRYPPITSSYSYSQTLSPTKKENVSKSKFYPLLKVSLYTFEGFAAKPGQLYDKGAELQEYKSTIMSDFEINLAGSLLSKHKSVDISAIERQNQILGSPKATKVQSPTAKPKLFINTLNSEIGEIDGSSLTNSPKLSPVEKVKSNPSVHSNNFLMSIKQIHTTEKNHMALSCKNFTTPKDLSNRS